MRNLILLPAAVAFKRGARVLPRVRGGALSSTATAQHFIDDVNAQYEALHTDFEAQFWGTKMALSTDHEPLSGPKRAYSVAELTKTKQAMEAFLGDEAKLETARALLAATDDAEEKKTLELMTRAFGCYIMESAEAKALRASATETEGALESARNSMTLGATFDGAFEELSSVALRSRMRVDGDETARKACYDGLRSIGSFVVEHGFVDLVKKRNAMAKALGYVDYYDYKVTQAEGFGKAQLFGMLDELERASRPIMEAARETLAADKGADALEPWNRGFAMAGDITRKLDPYFPFEKAVEVWGRSFAAMKITYRGASMDLDLLDRKGKYSNGFCHWPQPAWRRSDGSWQPAVTHFTSLADPSAVGSGMTGLVTLMHEAGHAAHFANTDVRSPLFSQERAPTSVPYAELQSMFLDSLVGDAAWRATYAKSRGGDVVPWALLEEDMTATHPYKVLALRSMLSVPYFEKALYEMADEDLTAASVVALADAVEKDIEGGLGPRPLLSVPHLLSDEASCYYHGYVLAEMAVHQTRAFVEKRDGFLVDNPKIGPTLTDAFWRPGNTEPFLDLVEKCTGAPLSGDAWVAELGVPLDELLASEKAAYDAAVAAASAASTDVDLDMRVRIVDGDAVLADTAGSSFLDACAAFESYVTAKYPAPK